MKHRVAVPVVIPLRVNEYSPPPHPLQPLFLVVLLILAVLTGLRWKHQSFNEFFSRYFLAILISSFENSLSVQVPGPLWNVSFVLFCSFLLWVFCYCFYIRDINPLSEILLTKILSNSLVFLFTWLIVSLSVQKVSVLRSHLRPMINWP